MRLGETVTSRSRWLVLAVAYLSVLSLAVIMQSIAPILSLVSDEMTLSHTQAGLLMGAFALPGIIAATPPQPTDKCFTASRFGEQGIQGAVQKHQDAGGTKTGYGQGEPKPKKKKKL